MFNSTDTHQGSLETDVLNTTIKEQPANDVTPLPTIEVERPFQASNISTILPEPTQANTTVEGIPLVTQPHDVTSTSLPEVAVTETPPVSSTTSGKAEKVLVHPPTQPYVTNASNVKSTIKYLSNLTTTITDSPIDLKLNKSSNNDKPTQLATATDIIDTNDKTADNNTSHKETSQKVDDLKRTHQENRPAQNGPFEQQEQTGKSNDDSQKNEQWKDIPLKAPVGPVNQVPPVNDILEAVLNVTISSTTRSISPPASHQTVAPSVEKHRTNELLMKTATGEVRLPPKKIGVLTLAQPVDPSTVRGGGGGQVHVAAIVVPVVCALLVLLVIGLLLLLILRRRARTRGYKRPSQGDEESSTDATSTLMKTESNGKDSQTPSVPVYAIVDKSKKRRATETVSVTDEGVGLMDLKNNNKSTVNESCPALGESTDSLLGDPTASRSYLDNDVFVTEREGPLYDVPPAGEYDAFNEEKKENDSEQSKSSSSVSKEEIVIRDKGDIETPNGDIFYGVTSELNNKEKAVQLPVKSEKNEGQVNNGLTKGIEQVKVKNDDPGVKGKNEDLTLIECDVYETADWYDPNRDDEDGMYEIPDSPATVRARQSMARVSMIQLEAGYLPETDERQEESLAIPYRADDGDTSDTSESGLDSDFEDLWTGVTGDPGDSKNNGKITSEKPPPLPTLLPESETELEDYLSPKCHTHYPPGPNWKPFHEYDPVYVPQSDPNAMNARVDNQNYVRGRQRSDSRQTNPYEEIQFGGIYDTVDDDDDDVLLPNQGPQNPIPVPPRVPIPPSPPPPLVPRRTRPISGVADMGRQGINKPLPPQPRSDTPERPETPQRPALSGWSEQEPRYSGLIMEDVSSSDDEVQHEYTALEYTKLRSVGSGTLLGDNDGDIKAIDETDSETYTKHAFTQNQQTSTPPLPPRRASTRNNATTNEIAPKAANEDTPLKEENDVSSTAANDKAAYKSGFLFENGGIITNGDGGLDYAESSSSDSDDSYEPVEPVSPLAKDIHI